MLVHICPPSLLSPLVTWGLCHHHDVAVAEEEVEVEVVVVVVAIVMT